MASRKRQRFQQLLVDQRGNTLMLIAGMFLPLLAMAGSGIDISRAYLTKARLQSACDAGVLAARKTQNGNTMTTESTGMGERYFAANFGKSAFGSHDIDFKMAMVDKGQIDGVAKAKLDTGLMQVFGQDKFDLTVNCSAIRDLSHTDVMFVLDTTGSMLSTNPGDFANRFETMKEAVTDFHGILEASRSTGVNLRYGFVPYAEMVNVGGLLPADMMVKRWTYQSRVPDGVATVTGTNEYGRYWTQVGGPAPSTTTTNFTATSTWIPPTPGSGGEFGSGGTPGYWSYSCSTPARTIVASNTVNISNRTEPFAGPPVGTRTIYVIRETLNGKDYSAIYDGSKCVMTETSYNNYVHEFEWVVDPTERTDHNWHYRPVEYDVADLITGGVGSSITVPIGNNHQPRSVTWRGCIEERDTVAEDNFEPLPTGALDLDIDSKPTTDKATQWRPALPALVFQRPDVWEEKTYANYANLADTWGGIEKPCPSPAKQLSPMTKMEVELYLDSLVAQGGTHHDIGMVWGARLISPSGIFSGANAGPQSRHIIFMTDGQIEASRVSYDSYGYPWLDRRRYPGGGQPTDAKINELIEKRFLAVCTAARARGLIIWSIAFGTTLSPAMQTCSGANRAFEADNSSELAFAFKQIAGGIAKLRLTK